MSDGPSPAPGTEGVATSGGTAPVPPGPTRGRPPARPPLYPRLLRLRHVAPNGWQRAVLGEGSFAVAAVLVLADRATAWTLVVLPAAVAGVVKGHDLLAGLLGRPVAVRVEPRVAGAGAGPGDGAGGADRTGGVPRPDQPVTRRRRRP